MPNYNSSSIIALSPSARYAERACKKDATKGRQLSIEPFCDCAPCHTQRRGIGCEHARGIAKHIAWELVEEDYECEGATRLALPLIKLIRSGRGMIAGESFDS